jgi:hypothetical protein
MIVNIKVNAPSTPQKEQIRTTNLLSLIPQIRLKSPTIHFTIQIHHHNKEKPLQAKYEAFRVYTNGNTSSIQNLKKCYSENL